MLNFRETQTQLIALVSAADALIAHGITDVAANALAFVLAHPSTDADTYARADELFDELEATICPRVILDARSFAQSATMADMLHQLAATNDS
jgi:hypothetical protein